MRWTLTSIVAAAGLLLLSTSAALPGQAAARPAADFKAKLDGVLAKLAAYDFGGDMGTVTALSELAAATSGRPAERKELAARLAAVLSSNAPAGAKDLACRQLSTVGTAAEVPALARLLGNEKLSHIARYALERIPGPAADDALRQALGTVQGNLLVGVVNSLGARRDEKAVGPLAGLLSSGDPALAEAAAAALGKIGPAAAEVLEKALAGAPPPVRPAVAESCLRSAEALLAQGQADQAARLYDRVAEAAMLLPDRLAAIRGAILARKAAAGPLLVEQLRADDGRRFALALGLVREMPGTEITKTVAAQLGTLPPDRQLLLVPALADRGDRAALPGVLRLAEHGPAEVRTASILALVKLGDASAVPLLVKAGSDGDAEVAEAARAVLAALPGKEVDAAILKLSDAAEAGSRRAAIDAIGQRRVAGAVPALVNAAADPDPTIRHSALRALGEMAELNDLSALAELLVKAKGADEVAAVEEALGSASAKIPDKDAAAEKLLAAWPQAEGESKVALVRVLGRIGGAKALETVRAAVADGREQVRDAALRALADWPDAAALTELARLAKTSQDRKYKVLALRGWIRLLGQSDLPAASKLAMCREALASADRDEEKKLVLGALGQVPTAGALALVVPYVDNPVTSSEAAAAAVAIAAKLVEARPAQVAEAMEKVLKTAGDENLKKRARQLLDQAARRAKPRGSGKAGK